MPVVITKDRLQEIESVAERVRQEACSHLELLGQEMCYDTDLVLITQLLMPATIVQFCPNLEHNGERLAGVLKHENGLWHLLCEQYDSPVRQRFSIAHELGHYFLHHENGDGSIHCCVSHYTDDLPSEAHQEGVGISESDGVSNVDAVAVQEAEADAFAAAFLLPASQLTDDVARFGNAAAYLARRHKVSDATMRRRLKTLGQLS